MYKISFALLPHISIFSRKDFTEKKQKKNSYNFFAVTYTCYSNTFRVYLVPFFYISVLKRIIHSHNGKSSVSWWIKFLKSVLTDHRQIVAEAARLTLSEIHSTSVYRCVVPLYIVDHQNCWTRKGGSEKGAWAKNAGIGRVQRLRHRFLSRVDSVTRRKSWRFFKF